MNEQEAEAFLRSAQDQPRSFIGHAGIGSRITLQDKDGVLIVKESLFSQLSVALGLLMFGPGLTRMAFFQKERVLKNPPFILAVIGFFSLIGWVFGFKYLYRLLAGRRVEIHGADGSVELYAGAGAASRRIERSQVQRVENHKTVYRTDRGLLVDNFTVRLTLADGETVDLFTSDSTTQIEAILSTMRTICGYDCAR